MTKGKKYEKYIKEFIEKWGNSLSIVSKKGHIEWVEDQHKIVGTSGGRVGI
ncbi:hypothetical protein [Paenibacillus oralis]|uniref:hypothetical protein n=1 Tax=Paenibacillus oralis TaxID=2490856 RepID=UPI0015B0A1EA|nr:hypothetical protein [Paenibacillus oralis]